MTWRLRNTRLQKRKKRLKNYQQIKWD